ncbi:helix-turn-helix transcriptional regulator [Brachybacterium sp. Marseille-Q2903]|uniref:Helix-turn-helix transcriptional regulator n=1 Tax=Brachybacterium epidermidis TaxID=2781983 RepID=A0ABR9W3G0_9MICO|nr:TetR/AcrR family transcriptional regulator [Brachybacterium epidermidis]MBE9404989.1 helix-turn-helix transcriptional regulator [Brachybacterium epidermidis]
MRADARAKRRAILDAAWRLIADRGAEVSMRTVALEAEVGIATLYRHFPTREDLIVGVLGEVFARVTEVVEKHDPEWADAPEAAWRATVHELARLEFGALVYQIAPTAQKSESLQRRIPPLRDKGARVIDALVQRARRAGVVDPNIRPERFLVGLAAISRPFPIAIEEILPGQREWMVSVYLDGLRGPATSPDRSSASTATA